MLIGCDEKKNGRQPRKPRATLHVSQCELPTVVVVVGVYYTDPMAFHSHGSRLAAELM